ncbi:MAG TPA: hypothetical protein VGJ73_18465 [Verrucomicrobiae bacterium]|jgi:hypothetical protein
MKIRINLICFCIVALLAAPGFILPSPAQSNQPRVENRLLLVFDTSSAMKRRLPNEAKAIDQLFQLTLNGKLRPGDSVGIWTFSRDLHLGQFPQQDWTPDMVNSLPPEIEGFLKKQRYAKDTRFEALIPTVNEVVRTSPRLTIVIFCDGDGQVNGIPGAASINASFKQHQHDMDKARMPFVIVLRSQFDRNQVGHYVGCTISSAQDVILPQFPPMQLPPPPAPTPVKVAPQQPPPVAPPLIVIGTNSETKPQTPVTAPPAAPPQLQPAPMLPPTVNPVTPAKPVPPAVSPPPSIPMAQTNSAPPPAAAIQPIQPTNTVVAPLQATVRPSPPPSALPQPPQSPGAGKNRLLEAGAGLGIVAIAIVYFLLRRSRSQNSTSLITESLKKR